MFIPDPPAPARLQLLLGGREFTESERIPARLVVHADKDLELRGARVWLECEVMYRYAQNNVFGGGYTGTARSTLRAADIDLDATGALAGGQAAELPVNLLIPASGPGSVSGALLQLKWVVHAEATVAGFRPISKSAVIHVLSAGAARSHVSSQPAVTVERHFVALGFDLGSRVLEPGRPVVGQLHVTGRRPGEGRGIRVELLLREQVHHGPWIGTDAARNPANQAKESNTVIAATVAAHQISVDPRYPVALPFRLQVPPRLPAPSLGAPEYTVSWILRATMDRAWRLNPYTEIELLGRTTLPEGHL